MPTKQAEIATRKIKIHNLEEDIRKLEAECESIRKEIEQKKKEIDHLERQNTIDKETLKPLGERERPVGHKYPTNNIAHVDSQVARVARNSADDVSRSTDSKSKVVSSSRSKRVEVTAGGNYDVNQIVNLYNQMPQEKTISNRSSIKQLLSQYNVVGFSCQNYEKRVNSPDLPPVFVESKSPVNGDFWAFPVNERADNNGYYVFPNKYIAYEEYRHTAGAYGYAFNSNYSVMDGKVYKVIQSSRPAIFVKTGVNWALKWKGILQLS